MGTKNILSTTADLNYPDVSPTLDLNFARNQKLDPRINFTRNSRTTYFDQNGILQTAGINQPVFEWDPVTKNCLGLRIFGSYNQLLASPEDPTSPSSSNAVIFSSSTDTPLPSNSHKLIETTASSAYHYAAYNISKAASSLEYQATVFVKAAGREVVINLQNAAGNSGVAVRFNPATGAYTTGLSAFGTGFTVGIASSQSLANGWYRLQVSCVTDTSTTIAFQLSLHNGTTNVYTGDGTSGVLIAGRNLTQGSVLYPYSPVAGFVAADSIQITGSNFSRFFNSSEGTIFVNYGPYANAGATINPGIFTIDGGDSTNVIRGFNGATTSSVFEVRSNSVQQFYISGYTLNPSAVHKYAASYKQNNAQRTMNGNVPETASLGSIPAVNRLLIGDGNGGVTPLNGYIRRLRYWPKFYSGTILQSITES